MDKFNFVKAITHAGKFHADDVFATTFIKLLNPEITVERVFKVPDVDDNTLVYDIGLGKYDHHQPEEIKERRPDGTAFSAFGKLWRDFSEAFGVRFNVSQKHLDQFDQDVVRKIDLTDNTGEPNELSGIISLFNQTWYEEENKKGDEKDPFEKAVTFATEYLMRKVAEWQALDASITAVMYSEIVDEHIMVLDKYVSFREVISDAKYKEIYFVIHPSNRGGFCICTVKEVNADGVEVNKVDFPKEWCGKSPAELATLQEGLTFCHPGNWLASADTREHAIAAAREAIRRS